MRYIFQATYRDGSGNIVSGGTVSIFLAGTTTPATVYTSAIGGSSVGFVTSGTDGSFVFYTDTSDYPSVQLFDLELSATGYQTKTYYSINVFESLIDQQHFSDGTHKGITTNTISATTATITTANITTANITTLNTSGLTFTDVIMQKPIADVRWYGAVGDGLADDTTAIQDAIDASSGYIVLFPKGTYKITSTLTITSGSNFLKMEAATITSNALPLFNITGSSTTFSLEGTDRASSKLVYTGASTDYMIKLGDGLSINEDYGFVRNIGFDGNNKAGGIKINQYRYGYIDNNKFLHVTPIALYMIGAFKTHVTRNNFSYMPTATATHAILMRLCTLTVIDNNRFETSDDTVTYGCTGISFEPHASLDYSSTSVTIARNLFQENLVGIDIPLMGTGGRISGSILDTNWFEGGATILMVPFKLGFTGSGNEPYDTLFIGNNVASSGIDSYEFTAATNVTFVGGTYGKNVGSTITMGVGIVNLLESGVDWAARTFDCVSYRLMNAYPIHSTQSWTPGIIASGSSVSGGFTVSGATVGSLVNVIAPYNTTGCFYTGEVYSGNAVRIVVGNLTGGPITLGAGDWTMIVGE